MGYYHKWKVCYYDLFAGQIWQKEKELIVPRDKFDEEKTLEIVKEQIYEAIPSVFNVQFVYEGVIVE